MAMGGGRGAGLQVNGFASLRRCRRDGEAQHSVE